MWVIVTLAFFVPESCFDLKKAKWRVERKGGENMDEREKKSFEQLHITAAEHPKALAPHVLIRGRKIFCVYGENLL